MPKCLLYILPLLLLTACQPTGKAVPTDNEPHYFRLTDSADCRIAEVFDPWHSGVRMARYVITHPLHRVAVTSATHIGYLKELDALSNVVAVTSPQLIYNLPVQPVQAIGEDIQLDLERLLLSHPDAIFITDYGQNTQDIARIEEAGIQVIRMVEWMEQSPLARAEWIRFVAAFMGCEDRADSIVTTVREQYVVLQTMAERVEKRRSVLSGASYRGTWYVPSGSTYMGRLFHDAAADYAYENETSEGSIPLTDEQAIRTFEHAEVWLGCNAESLDELRSMDEKLSWLTAFQAAEVYNFYRRRNDTGANDFWETGVVHPERILADIIWALYPDMTEQDYQPNFINKLQ